MFATAMAVVHLVIGFVSMVVFATRGNAVGCFLAVAIFGLAYVWVVLAIKARRAALGDKMAAAFLHGYGSVLNIFPPKR